MQMTIYYATDDEWLIKKLQDKSAAERRSVSATILLILEQYFQKKGEEIPTRTHKPKRRSG